MPDETIARMVGDSRIFNTKGNPVDHCCKSPAGMAHGINKAEDDIAESLLPKRKR